MTRVPMLAAALLVSLLASSLSAATPRAGIEQEVAPARPIQAAYGRDIAGAAFHGDQGFVVWTDNRLRSHGLAYGSRIDRDGNLLDTDALPLFIQWDVQSRALDVAWVKDGWVAFWVEGSTLMARRVETSGAVGSPVVVTRDAASLAILSMSQRAVATNGTTVLFTWSNILGRFAYLIDGDLAESLQIPIGNLDIRTVAVRDRDYVGFGRRFLGPGPRSESFRLSEDGLPVWTTLTETPEAAAWTGRDYLAVYYSAADGIARVARLSDDLSTRRDVFTFHPSPGFDPAIEILPQAGGGAVLVWSDLAGAHAVTLTSDEVGEPVKLASFSGYSVEKTVTVQSDSDVVLFHRGNTLLFSKELAPRSTLQSRIATIAAQQQFSATRDGSGGPIVFIEEGDDRQVVLADGPGSISAIIAGAGRVSTPSVASSGRTSLVVWVDEEGTSRASIQAAVVGLDGHPIVPSAITVGPNHSLYTEPWTSSRPASAPAVAWTGQMYLVAWIDQSRSLVYKRVLESGVVLDVEPRTISVGTPSGGEGPSEPALMRAGDVTIVAWAQGNRMACNVTCTGLPSIVRAARLSSDGQILDPAGVDLGTDPYSGSPRIAAAGNEALIIWQGNGIKGRRVTSGVFASDNIFIADGYAPSITRHHDQFLIAWQGSTTEVRAAIATTSGQPGPHFLVATDTLQAEGPFAWTTAGGNAAVTYSRRGPQTGLVPRLFYRVIEEGPVSRRRATRR